MATSHTLLGDSPTSNRRKFRVDSDGGGGGTETISNADLIGSGISGLRAGPLRRRLQTTYVSQSAARDAIGNSTRTSIYVTPRFGAAAFHVDVNIDINGLPVLEVVVSAASSEAAVELVYHHSIPT